MNLNSATTNLLKMWWKEPRVSTSGVERRPTRLLASTLHGTVFQFIRQCNTKMYCTHGNRVTVLVKCVLQVSSFQTRRSARGQEGDDCDNWRRVTWQPRSPASDWGLREGRHHPLCNCCESVRPIYSPGLNGLFFMTVLTAVKSPVRHWNLKPLKSWIKEAAKNTRRPRWEFSVVEWNVTLLM